MRKIALLLVLFSSCASAPKGKWFNCYRLVGPVHMDGVDRSDAEKNLFKLQVQSNFSFLNGGGGKTRCAEVISQEQENWSN